MKGVVFTHFMDLVEEAFGLDVLDRVIDTAELQVPAAYTSVGTYPFEDLASMLGQLSKEVQVPPEDLLFAFGKYLFPKLIEGHPEIGGSLNSPLQLIHSVEDVIHVEVLKLYPDAELPKFETEFEDENHLKVHYTSKRGLADLAVGLIVACGEHFEKPLVVERDPDSSPDDATFRISYAS